MRTPTSLLMFASLVAACSTEPADMVGTWVVTFPSLFVPSNGFGCASLSGTVLEIAQNGDQVTAPFSQGLLACSSSPIDSTEVPFAQGRIRGTLDGNRLDFGFEGAAGRFTGMVNGNTASGDVDYTDATYSVTITGHWLAQRRTPTGAINLTFATTSGSGLGLPSVLLTLDGDTVLQAPQNGGLALTGLTGGRHLLRVATGGSESCAVTGGPSGSPGGINPNDQFIDIIESDPLRAVAYQIGCA